MPADALASFEAKWSLHRPELALALRFAPRAERHVASALYCLFEEITDVAFRVAERDIAARKLHWWAEELAGLPTAQARHPLSEVLQQHAGLRELSSAHWAMLLQAGLAHADQAPATSMAELLYAYRRFSEPLAAIAATLHPRLDRDTTAQALALSRALRDCSQLASVLAMGRLPLPLDLLARHRLSRADLVAPGASRDAALREHCAALRSAMRNIDREGLNVLTVLTLQVDEARCQSAARAADPWPQWPRARTACRYRACGPPGVPPGMQRGS